MRIGLDQLTAEVRVPQRTSRGESFVWVRQRSRNEVLDCTVYGIFVSHVLDLHRYTDAMWGKLEAAVQPPVRDIFDQAEAPLPVPAEA